MKDILLTSSVLIAALLLLRLLFRRAISRRVQYALWLLVAVRLLIPVSFPAADFSVLTAAEPVSRQITAPSLYMEPVREEVDGPADLPAQDKTPEGDGQIAIGNATADNTRVFTDEKNVTHTVEYARQIRLTDLLYPVWYAGIAAMLIWMLHSNLRFWRMLRRERVPYEVAGCLYPVYLVADGLSSPCLFGLASPAIYLTPAAVETPERLRHVIAHESAHARHFDHLWALLRGLCLALYWFDPLVWAAAAASKADGELACDESALRQLGDAERIPYGRTLLALIPVGSRTPTALLSTSMTAGKRHLKDRVMRIAQNRRTVTAALFAVIALTAGVCAVTFTGGKTIPQTEEPRPLTGEKLAYFNEEFFNGDTFNIHNQFLTSLYGSPEEIDLFSLLYNGTGLTEEPTDAERQAVAQARYGGEDPGTDLIKISATSADAILEANTGLTLEETNQVDLDTFTYLPEYDAYYHFHGDTNYPGTAVFSSGEQEGHLIRLYYQDFSFGGYGTKCVTLEEQSDGSYWFVSHLFTEKTAIPTVYPAGEPVLTISLADLSPYEPERPQVVRHTGDLTEESMLTDVYDDSYILYRSTDGNLYAAVENEIVSDESGIVTWDVGCFFTFPSDTEFSQVTVTDFYDLFGHSGIAFSYYGQFDDDTHGLITNYYCLDADGAPLLLARTCGEAAAVDLDGNGENELLTDHNQLFFQREGALYEADITALLEANWPEMDWWDYSLIDTSRRCLAITGLSRDTSAPEGSQSQYNFIRYCYFDGENLLFYDDITTYTDHVADGIDVPEYALEAARDQVLEELARWQARSDTAAEWDDWHITSLSQVDLGEPYTSLGLEVYSLSYELHSPTPEQVMAAGGMYVLEDGWVGGFYVESPFVVFLHQADGTYTQLESTIPGDGGADIAIPAFRASIAQMAMDNGLLVPSQMDRETILDLFSVNGISFLNSLGNLPETEQAAAVEALASFHNQGLFEEEGDLRHTMQNIVWSQNSLTAGGAAVWQTLLSRTGITPSGIGNSYDRLDEAILQSISDHCADLSGHQADFCAASYTTLDSIQFGNTRTEYLLTCFGSYDLTEDGSYTLKTGGTEPAALTFATINGLYQLTEYWTPTGGSQYADDLRTVFPEETAQAALSPSAETRSSLEQRRDQRAQEQFDALQAAAPQEQEAQVFTAADAEFTNQPLETEADPMTYEERLAWCQGGWQNTEASVLFRPASMQSDDACIAYTGNMVGGPPDSSAWKYLYLRFADGTLANLPLPHNALYSTGFPDTMDFAGNGFTYTITFSDQLTNPDTGELLHLKGTYRYTVDLEAKTVSLSVTSS